MGPVVSCEWPRAKPGPKGNLALRKSNSWDSVAQTAVTRLKISIPLWIVESERKALVKENISQDVFCIVKSFAWGTNTPHLGFLSH